ncbi:MAG: MFS transporter [Dehalococcoidia bacterium]|nr:MFS transporter [Dehalococcoidia bacterium]
MAVVRSSMRAVPAVAAVQKDKPAVSRHWVYSFSLFKMASDSVDTVLLVFAAALGASATTVALVDAVGDIGAVVGLVVIGGLADKLGPRWWFLGLLLACPALVMFGFAATSSIALIIGLSVVWGIVFVGPMPLTSVIIMRSFPQHRWSEQHVRISTMNTLGTTMGMVVAVVWLGIGEHFLGDLAALRIFFMIGVGLIVASTVTGLFWLGRAGSAPDPTLVRVSKYQAARPAASGNGARYGHAVPAGEPLGEKERRAASRAPYSDRLKSVFVVNGVYFIGLGMSVSVIPVYLRSQLNAPVFLMMSAAVASSLASTFSMPFIGRAMSKPMSLRLFPVAIGVRGLLLIAVGLVGFVLPQHVALGAVVLCMVGVGVCGAAVSVCTSLRVSRFAPPGMVGSTSGRYTALTFLALAVGSVAGGVIAEHVGYSYVFALSALWLFVAAVLSVRL